MKIRGGSGRLENSTASTSVCMEKHLPSYHMARQVVKDLMPGLPSASVDIITAKRAELLAKDRLRELCRRYGFKFPEREMTVEVP